MAPTNRAALITATFKVLKKKFKPAPVPPERTLLEHWIYGCCLENTGFEEADKAYKRLTESAFDWNEMRVTTVSELAEQVSSVTNPHDAAVRVKRTLQGVFEWKYTYDLEPLKKQNLGKTVKDLLRLPGTSPFSVSYVVQHALEGHSIPLDSGLLDAMYIVGVIDEKERKKEVVPGLERSIPKKNGIADGSLLHQLGATVAKSPYSPSVRELLLSINADATPRLPKRQRKKKAAPVKEAPAPVVEEPKAKSKAKTTKKAAKKTPTKKAPAAAKKKKVAPAKAKKAPVKKKAAAPKKKKAAPAKKTKKKKSAKKSTTKQLSKRKPR